MSQAPELRTTSLLSLVGRSWWVVLLYGLIAIGFGLIAIARPLSAAAGLAWAIGVMALVDGLVILFAAFSGNSGAPRGWALVYALASIGFGALAVINPLVTAKVLLLAIWLILAGVYRIVFAIRVRRQIEGEWLLIVSGVLAIVLGVMMFGNPLGGVAVTTLWIGIGSLIYGVLQVVVAFRLRKLR
jgi:uncharacterized membrane protein HdeD (DUF308 family)